MPHLFLFLFFLKYRPLDEFGNEMTTVQSRLDKVTKGMQDLLQTSNNNVICLIIFLTIVACVLFFLVVYT